MTEAQGVEVLLQMEYVFKLLFVLGLVVCYALGFSNGRK